MEKIWQIASENQTEDDLAQIAELAETVGISEFLAGMLFRRNIRTKEAAKKFLSPLKEQPLHSPWLLPDMKKAVDRLETALKTGEKICVYGDYDTDGTTATAILVRALSRYTAAENVSFYIPDRFKEGYGLNRTALENIAAQGTTLLVSVDCGIKSGELIAETMLNTPLDIIVTDHHLPDSKEDKNGNAQEIIPAVAVAVVNPHCHHGGAHYPFEDICGAMVAFKLAQAIAARFSPAPKNSDSKESEYAKDIELAAIGTIGDVMPLLDENRRFVLAGLKALNHTDNIGLRALLNIAGIKKDEAASFQEGRSVWMTKSSDIAFFLSPLLNSAGRLDKAEKVVQLLLAADLPTAEKLAAQLSEFNLARQSTTKNVLHAAIDQLKAETAESGQPAAAKNAVIASGKNWHLGVIGLVAARLVEKYYRPTIVFSLGEDGIAKGSARSIDGFHIHDALKDERLTPYLVRFGGHAKAAGLAVRTENLAAFETAFQEIAAETITAEMKRKKIAIECLIEPLNLKRSLLDDIACLEPTGEGNRPPLFAAKNIWAADIRTMGKNGEHLAFRLASDGKSFDAAKYPRAVYWRAAEILPLLQNSAADFSFQLEADDWQGRNSLQCRIEDVLVKMAALSPERLRKIYRALRLTALSTADKAVSPDHRLAKNIGLSEAELKISLAIFKELEFFHTDASYGFLRYILVAHPPKRNLADSSIYQKLQ